MIKHHKISGSFRLAAAAAGLLAAFSLNATSAAQEPGQSAAPEGQQQRQPQLQALESIAAKVNDKAITTFDVRQRIQLIALTSGGRIPEQAMAQVQQKALQDLVEEQLKIAEAESIEFDIDPRDVDDEIAAIAANAGNSVEELEMQLNASGISMDTVRRQIRTRLLWENLVQARYGSRINITEDEVDQVMARLRAESRDEQYLVSEICLPVRDDTTLSQIEQAGMQIINQMQQGAPFETMARQFSVCTTAANGGDLGWLRAGELDPMLGNVVRQLDEGAVSRPIPFEGTVKILAVRQIRQASEQGEKSYELGYASVPASMPQDEAADIFARLPESNICNGDLLSRDLGKNVSYELLPMLPASQIQAPFRNAVEALDRNEVTEPIRNGEYWHAAVLCTKDEGLGLPSRAQIKDRLYADQLELISRRYLRDVERDASVQILLGNEESQSG